MTTKNVINITVKVNGKDHTAAVEPRLLLVHFIREVLALTGTHIGCDTTSCGACTILLDGRPVKSCTMFAVQVDGREVSTIEGVAQNGALHPLQEGFKEKATIPKTCAFPGWCTGTWCGALTLTPESSRFEPRRPKNCQACSPSSRAKTWPRPDSPGCRPCFTTSRWF